MSATEIVFTLEAKGGLKIQPLGEGGCSAFESLANLTREEMMAVNQGPKPPCGGFFV